MIEHRAPSLDVNRLEPGILLDSDMHRDDLILALERLRFQRNGFGRLWVDREVSSYLIAALRRNHGPAYSR
jgi:hypothetical protein